MRRMCSLSRIASSRARQSHFIGRASQPARLLLTSPRFLREAAFGLFWSAGLFANRPLLAYGPILCGLLSGLFLLAVVARALGLVVALFLIAGLSYSGPSCAGPGYRPLLTSAFGLASSLCFL